MAIGQKETGRAVVECRSGPTSRCVACRAIRKRKGRPGCWVYRIGGLLPGCQVASRVPAIVQRGRQIVIAVDMAEGASHVGMALGQRETGRAVVEFGVQPGVKRMACLAGGGELCGNVVGINCFLKIRLVAGHAGS